MKYTNREGILLPLAVMLAYDEYPHSDDKFTIGVTTLIKSTRQILLNSRINGPDAVMDISDKFHVTQGNALHNHMEKAWKSDQLDSILESLCIPSKVRKQIRVNPTEGHTPYDIYTEKRTNKKVGKWTVSGEFDFAMEGKVMDLKNTVVSNWNGDHTPYILQLSLYRWLNPEIITKNIGVILYWFKNYVQYHKKEYPPYILAHKEFILMSPDESQDWVEAKLKELSKYMDEDESKLPACSPSELWQSPPEYKYYSKPDAKKAGKVFHTYTEAYNHMLAKGKGHVKEVKAKPTACSYCNARSICSQYSAYVIQGII